MSAEALSSFQEARQRQLSRIQARKIRAQVHQARQNPLVAGARWPFELLQNAVDAGPRSGRSHVTVAVTCDATKVVFEHDGDPFEFDELAALLSGGSSKDYESEETTGRFGTGFLVTHVLAESVRLWGLLSVGQRGLESFELTLDRGGDEEAILRDIQASSSAISAAKPVSDIRTLQTAVFEYQYSANGIAGAVDAGLCELRRALPYLYVTRPALGRVEIQDTAGETETWSPSDDLNQVSINGGFVATRAITVDAKQRRKLQVHRFVAAPKGSASAIVLVERTPRGLRVCRPDQDAPRVFRDYPLRSSGFLPVNFVLNGKFEVQQERNALLMSDAIDKPLLQDALSAGVVGVRYAIEQKWEGAHWLAEAKPPSTGFRTESSEETRWWTDQLRDFAERLSIAALVQCENEMLPAVSASVVEHATFVVPRLLRGSAESETTFERLLPLVAAASRLRPPIRSLAPDWTKIAEGWSSLGVELELTCVADVAKSVRGSAKTVSELNVNGVVDVQQWLAEFIDVVGECWSARDGIDESALEGLMPDQSGRLRSPGELKRDNGVSETLKDICADLELEVRHELLTDYFEKAAHRLRLRHLPTVLRQSFPTEAGEDGIVAQAIKRIDEMLPEAGNCEQVPAHSRLACVQLLAHLWQTKGTDARPIATQVPLIASDQSGVRWSPRRRFMAPVCVWPESAQPFAEAYPPDRVLHPMYANSELDGGPDVSTPLAEWGMAFNDPIVSDTFDLRDRRLAVLAPADIDTTGYHVPRVPMSQVALLSPELLNRAESDMDRARDLLGLVLCHVAPSDASWKERQAVQGRKKDDDQIDLCIPMAVWLADLKVRAWVPVDVPGEDGKVEAQKMAANAATLRALLHSPWLEDNNDAIRLLSDWFGFDQLDLRLLGMTQDQSDRQELRNSLARLVESAGADPQVYLRLAKDVEARERQKRDVDRCRRLGLAIQDRIGAALKNHDLDVELVDKGFDFEVALRNDDVLHDMRKRLELGPYLVEVKATRTGQARLTPLQAETATNEQARYVLCVVDLREVPAEDLDMDNFPPHRVEALARVVPDVGASVAQTYGSVELAKMSDVALRNESALRYEVPPGIWESSGVSIGDWVSSIKATLVQD